MKNLTAQKRRDGPTTLTTNVGERRDKNVDTLSSGFDHKL
jgi:hypothetical protein